MLIRTRRFAQRSLAALSLAAVPAMAQPANDACTSPAPLSLNTPVNGTTIGAGADMQVTCQGDIGDVWYSFTPKTFGAYVFTATGSANFNLSLALISGCEFPIAEFGCSAVKT